MLFSFVLLLLGKEKGRLIFNWPILGWLLLLMGWLDWLMLTAYFILIKISLLLFKWVRLLSLDKGQLIRNWPLHWSVLDQLFSGLLVLPLHLFYYYLSFSSLKSTHIIIKLNQISSFSNHILLHSHLIGYIGTHGLILLIHQDALFLWFYIGTQLFLIILQNINVD